MRKITLSMLNTILIVNLLSVNMASGGGPCLYSDEIFDFPCSLCARKHKNNQAKAYCVECEEYMCTACVDSHNNFPQMAKHSLLGNSHFGATGKVGSGSLPSVPTERCSVHTTKLIDLYCENHDTVGCVVCFSINHGSCKNKHYIPEYAEKILNIQLLQPTENDLQYAISVLKRQELQGALIMKANTEAKTKCLKEIRDFRVEINQAINKLEQESITLVQQEYVNNESVRQQALQKTHRLLDDLKRIKRNINASHNKSQQFVAIKLSEVFLKESRVISHGLTKNTYIEFIRNMDILTCLEGKNSLGNVVRKEALYKVVNKESCHIRLADDLVACDVWSLCVLDSGNILLADYANNKLKLINTLTNKICDSIKLPANPRFVCRISRSEAAVSLSDNTIQYVNVENQLVPTRSMKTDHTCRGMSVIGDSIYIADNFGGNVNEYSLNGKYLVRTISNDQKGSSIFSSTREMAASDDGKAVHVTDADKGLVTFDRAGNVVRECSVFEPNDAWGVCCDGNGNVFVSGYLSENVVQISATGKYLGEVINESFDIGNPQGMCFDRSCNVLVIATDNDSRLHFFEIA